MIEGAALETHRLVVRPFEPADAPLLVRLFEDPRVHRYVDDGDPLSLSDAKEWVVRSRENLARFGYGTGAVVTREDATLIGWAGFARPGDGTEEIIYGLAADCWGLGFGSELLQALLTFADARAMNNLRATVDPTNVASVHLLTRAGFRLTDSASRQSEPSDLYVRQSPQTDG